MAAEKQRLAFGVPIRSFGLIKRRTVDLQYLILLPHSKVLCRG